MKIVLLPLDERPCNYFYPQIMPYKDFTLVLPPVDIMSKKKKAASFDNISKWLIDECKDADAAVVSLDMLIYGGIIPSRLHHESVDVLKKRIDVLKTIKLLNPSIKIFADQLIMRCPSYSLSDEEPDYFDQCGLEIFLYGGLIDKEKRGILTPDEIIEKEQLFAKIGQKNLADFTNRRKINIEVLLSNLELVKSEIIDFFVIPQDDSAPLGFTSMDQQVVNKIIRKGSYAHKVAMYPGADEIGLTLLAKSINTLKNEKPRVFVYYASTLGNQVIPAFEDRIVDETIKWHIFAAGCMRVESIMEADMVLTINIGSETVTPNDTNGNVTLTKNRNLDLFIEYIEYAKELGKLVGVCDVTYCNRADILLLKLLRNNDFLFEIDAYAGWNTSSNTIGTVLSALCLYSYSKDKELKNKFLAYRYIEDFGYMDVVRDMIIEDFLPKYSVSRFDISMIMDDVKKFAYENMDKVINKFSKEVYKYFYGCTIDFPWERTFEISLKLK